MRLFRGSGDHLHHWSLNNFREEGWPSNGSEPLPIRAAHRSHSFRYGPKETDQETRDSGIICSQTCHLGRLFDPPYPHLDLELKTPVPL
jgi:hypothetical protein